MCKEESIEVNMQHFCEVNFVSCEAFLEEAFRVTKKPTPPEVLDDVMDMGGIEVLISIYCARDCNFDRNKFLSEVQKLDIKPKHANIIYAHMQTLRRSAEQAPKDVVPVFVPVPQVLQSTSSMSVSTCSNSSSSAFAMPVYDYGVVANYTLLDDLVDTQSSVEIPDSV